MGKLFRADDLVSNLQFKISDDGAEIGIAAALAISIDAALDVSRALLDGRQGVGHCDVRIVVRMNTDNPVESAADLSHDLGNSSGKRSTVGVAQAENIGPSLLGGFQRS